MITSIPCCAASRRVSQSTPSSQPYLYRLSDSSRRCPWGSASCQRCCSRRSVAGERPGASGPKRAWNASEQSVVETPCAADIWRQEGSVTLSTSPTAITDPWHLHTDGAHTQLFPSLYIFLAKKINNCPSLLSVYRHFSARLLCKRNVRLVTFSLMFPVLIRHATVTTMKVEGMCVYIVPPTSGKTCSICISFLVF